jgi:hypothetical protein
MAVRYRGGGVNPPLSVSDYRFVITAVGTVVYDSGGKYIRKYETEDSAVEMVRLAQER